MVYCATSPSLAVLELLAHVDPDDAPEDLVLVELAVPGRRRPIPDDLPTNWNAVPAQASTQAYGTAWIETGDSLTLSVPSVLLPTTAECVVLLNPAHRSAPRVTRVAESPFAFDRRLFGPHR